jgi:hypothetical protein
MPVITRSKQRAMDHDTALVQLRNTSLNDSSTDYSSSLTKSPMDSKLSIFQNFKLLLILKFRIYLPWTLDSNSRSIVSLLVIIF